jgi:hypothetical protein
MVQVLVVVVEPEEAALVQALALRLQMPLMARNLVQQILAAEAALEYFKVQRQMVKVHKVAQELL